MTCISPIAPTGLVALTRPPLSWRITSRIQRSGTSKRRDAWRIHGPQGSCGGPGGATPRAEEGAEWTTRSGGAPPQAESVPASARAARAVNAKWRGMVVRKPPFSGPVRGPRSPSEAQARAKPHRRGEAGAPYARHCGGRKANPSALPPR